MRARLLRIADSENRQAQRQASISNDMGRRAELLGAAVPACYLNLIAGMRAAVREFNAQLIEVPERTPSPLVWYESPNVTLRDTANADGMRVRVSRGSSYFDMLLRMISRSGKADIPLIEGHGSIGRDVHRTDTMMRIEGWVEGSQVRFWLSIDFKRLDIALEEVPDRIVMAVASHDYSLLSRNYGTTQQRPKSQEELDEDT